MPGDFDVFLSYDRGDATIVRTVAAELAGRGVRTWLDVERMVPSTAWRRELQEAIGRAPAAAVLLGGGGLGPVMEEEVWALLDQRTARGIAVVPVLLPGVDEARIPPFLRNLHWVDLRQGVAPGGIDQLVRGIRRGAEPGPPPPGRGDIALLSGSLPRAAVFGPGPPLHGQTFAVELLAQPVLLARDLAREAGGRTRVTIDRRGVVSALHDNAGKRRLAEATFADPERREAACRLDREVHRFLLGEPGPPFLRVEGFPLRWASGGVMSVVRWQGRTWTPFFFRDIAPFGWNLALGASERDDDLNDPWTFLVREFLEETLVLAGAPRLGGREEIEPFLFDHLQVEDQVKRAREFAAGHLRARFERDGLAIRFPEIHSAADSRATDVSLAPAPVDLLVLHEGGEARSRSFLVAVNLLEMGIEIVKVVEYELGAGGTLLDGELYEVDGRPELVRMPVALIAHDYLARAFGPGAPELAYGEGFLPSFEAPPIPPEDFHLFPFDAERRRDLATTEVARASAWERERYESWLDRFGPHFFDERGEVTNRNPSRLFTPTAAKIASYYFASRARGGGLS